MANAEPNVAGAAGKPRDDIAVGARRELVAAIVAGVLLGASWVLTAVDQPLAASIVVHASLAIGLYFGGKAALESLLHRRFDIDALMFVGAALAATPWVGAPAEGALLLFLFTLSGALEDLAMARTTRAVEALHSLMPTAALRLVDGQWVHAEPGDLVPGDRVRILPGELVPTDARLELGATSVNQASLTGESMPRDVQPGDTVFAGTINVGNPVEAVVTKPASQSSLQKIVDLVTQAQTQRQPVQRVIDKLSQPYAVGVACAAVLVALVWRYALGYPWNAPPDAHNSVSALYTAITLLIVASPCALIIATPTATLAAISRGARMGVLFKGGQSLQRLAGIQAIAFDKTGTLTIGKPVLLQVHAVAWSRGKDLLAVAAALEAQSTHPIAHAITEAAAQRSIVPAVATELRAVAGRGVSAMVDGHEARLGSLKHTEEMIPVCLRARVRELLALVQHRGQIAVVCAYDEQAAVLILADAARPGAECLTERLHEIGVGPVVMLTGDNALTAAKVAGALKLDEYHAELLPPDKVTHVQRLKAPAVPGGRGRVVGVIGDGVNDAPALAAADVSLAIGSIGSDAALESADIVLLSDDLLSVPRAIQLARRARRTININLIFALGAMVIMAIVTLTASAGLYGQSWQMPLWLGVLGHEGGTLLVVANSLLLLGGRYEANCTCDRGPGGAGGKHAHGHTHHEHEVPAAAAT